MNVTATYKFVKTPEGYRAVRQGDLQIYGFGHEARREAIGAAAGHLHACCRRSSARSLRPEIKLQGFKFNSGKLAAAGQLVPQEIIAQDGWLAIGYCRVKSSGLERA